MTNEPDPLAHLEHQLRQLLIAGIAMSSALLAVGLLVTIAAPHQPAGSRMLDAGLIILMATPMMRVIVSMIEYVRIREWFFVATTLIVFVELTVGVVYALRR